MSLSATGQDTPVLFATFTILPGVKEVGFGEGEFDGRGQGIRFASS